MNQPEEMDLAGRKGSQIDWLSRDPEFKEKDIIILQSVDSKGPAVEVISDIIYHGAQFLASLAQERWEDHGCERKAPPPPPPPLLSIGLIKNFHFLPVLFSYLLFVCLHFLAYPLHSLHRHPPFTFVLTETSCL